MYLLLLLYTGRFSTINYHSIVSPCYLIYFYYNISSKGGGGEWGMKKRNIEEIYLMPLKLIWFFFIIRIVLSMLESLFNQCTLAPWLHESIKWSCNEMRQFLSECVRTLQGWNWSFRQIVWQLAFIVPSSDSTNPCKYRQWEMPKEIVLCINR